MNLVGWGSAQSEPSFGGSGVQDSASVKAKMINLINSVRTLMRGKSSIYQRIPPQESATNVVSVPLIFVNLLIIVWAITFG